MVKIQACATGLTDPDIIEKSPRLQQLFLLSVWIIDDLQKHALGLLQFAVGEEFQPVVDRIEDKHQ